MQLSGRRGEDPQVEKWCGAVDRDQLSRRPSEPGCLFACGFLADDAPSIEVQDSDGLLQPRSRELAEVQHEHFGSLAGSPLVRHAWVDKVHEPDLEKICQSGVLFGPGFLVSEVDTEISASLAFEAELPEPPKGIESPLSGSLIGSKVVFELLNLGLGSVTGGLVHILCPYQPRLSACLRAQQRSRPKG